MVHFGGPFSVCGARNSLPKGPSSSGALSLSLVHLLFLGGVGGIKIGEIKTHPNLRNGPPRCVYASLSISSLHSLLTYVRYAPVKLKSDTKESARICFVCILRFVCDVFLIHICACLQNCFALDGNCS